MSELLKINVNDHVEKKNGLSYLSWAWAWAEVLKIDPDAQWIAHEYGPQGSEVPYMQLPDGSCMVKVTVTIKGSHKSCLLPVMNHRNQAIKGPDAFAVNTAIMRCMTKAVSMHGLGLYIYAGEDLPEDEGSPSFRGKNPLDQIANTGLQPGQAATYPVFLPQQEEPVSVHQSGDAWVDAYLALMKRVEDSKKIADPRQKMTKLREIKEANADVLERLEPVSKAKVVGDYQLRIRRLGAQQEKTDAASE